MLSIDTDPTGGAWESPTDGLRLGPAPEPGWWATLRAQHERTGWWPLLLGALSERDPGRPWRDPGDLHPGQIKSRPEDHYPGALLGGWAGDDWSGLASPGILQEDPGERADRLADEILAQRCLALPRIGLIRSGRGADTITDVAWTGPTNFENDTAKISAVLRNWEDRFGARLIGVGFDVLYLSVAAPPVDAGHALAVAAEHYAFCPDNVDQGSGDLEEYASDLLDAPVWSFWWD
ncbi:DUF4253 domain-containing protein [Actinoplanes sp. NPDC051861]|uniref:DUF4253 domain-containing protein n=1 Tax=Actinoplanes sp. NPDC051861 TaxID=3155170 RepID=UPI0034175D97